MDLQEIQKVRFPKPPRIEEITHADVDFESVQLNAADLSEMTKLTDYRSTVDF